MTSSRYDSSFDVMDTLSNRIGYRIYYIFTDTLILDKMYKWMVKYENGEYDFANEENTSILLLNLICLDQNVLNLW